jgi:hypothetical protein
VNVGEALAVIDNPNVLHAEGKIFLDLFLNVFGAIVS